MRCNSYASVMLLENSSAHFLKLGLMRPSSSKHACSSLQQHRRMPPAAGEHRPLRSAWRSRQSYAWSEVAESLQPAGHSTSLIRCGKVSRDRNIRARTVPRFATSPLLPSGAEFERAAQSPECGCCARGSGPGVLTTIIVGIAAGSSRGVAESTRPRSPRCRHPNAWKRLRQGLEQWRLRQTQKRA